MDYLNEPEDPMREPTGFEPLEWDDEEYEDEYGYDDDSYTQDEYEEEEYDQQGLAGWDNLRPFGSFNDGFGWDDTL